MYPLFSARTTGCATAMVRGFFVAMLGGWMGAAVPVAEGALGTITSLAVNGNRLSIVCGSDLLEVQVCSTNILRMDYRPGGVGDARTAMIGTTNWTYAGATIDTNSNPIVITTPAMHISIARSPCRVSVADAVGSPLVWEPAAEGVFQDGVRLAHAAGTDFYGIHGYNSWDDSSAGILRSAGGWAEAGYQGACGAPLIWNRHGFGLLVDSDGIQFNATATNLVAEYCSRTEVEFYVLVGDPRAILSAAAAVSGRPPMFPKWGMGFANTEWGITQNELTNIVSGYRSRAIPIDLYILDFDWKDWGADHYGEWNWNSTKFPGGASGALKSQMAAQGIRIGGIMKPRVHVYTEQGGYATTNGFWWPGQAEYSDYFSAQPVKDVNFSNANCRQWFFNHITNAFKTGIVAWWNDEADQAGGGGQLFGNWQFMDMQRALYDGQRGLTNQRVWSINRNFWLGGQRYAYAMWSGDIDGGFTSMANQRERMLSAIHVGEARWGMDIGGFNNAGSTTAECYARWMQFGSVVPIFRVHGQENQQRQPWVYGAQAEQVATAAIRLRYRLIPYVYSYDRRLNESGVGIVRSLAVDFPGDPNTANDKDAWMFGDYLLAAPVLTQGQAAKSIYLPAGRWRDFIKGTEYAGGQTISYPVNSSTWEDLPLFAREGAIIPMQPVMNHVGELPVTNVDLVMLPSTNQTAFVYYDDDGETYGYETGAFFRQTFSLVDNGGVIQADFSAPAGTYAPELAYYYAYVQCATNSGVTVNGDPLARVSGESALRVSPSAGWTHATNQFGYAALVKIPAGVEQHVALSNNLTATPVFSPAGGTYAGLVQVTLSCATPGVEIRYTVNGADPDETSALYDSPLQVSASAVIRARAYAAGHDPSVVASATYTIDANLLNNPGFETVGSDATRAQYWYTGEPDAHGQAWGTAARVDWGPRSGSGQAAVRGQWSGGNTGGFWQEVPATPGRSYAFSGWFHADSTWTASAYGIKLEFLSGATGGVVYLESHTNLLAGIGTAWAERSLEATAPVGAQWVRVVVFADGAGQDGSLHLDDLRLETSNTRTLLVSSEHGAPIPSVGLHVENAGVVLTNSVASPIATGLVEYVCTGWNLAGNAPATGTSNRFVMTLTNDAQLVWNWQTNTLAPSVIEFTAATYSANEGVGSAWITLQRDTTNGTASIRVVSSNQTATAGSDYEALSALAEFAAGSSTASVELVIYDDLIDEPGETLQLRLTEPGGAGAIGAQSNAVFTIVDNDEPMPDRTLEVTSAHGACDPAVGLHSYAHGTVVSCVVTGALAADGTQRVCTGWSGSGCVPVSGNSTSVPPFELTNDSTVAWRWNTNVYLSVGAESGGTVTGAVTGWQPLGTSVTLTATAATNHVFAGWGGDVPLAAVMENPLAITLAGARAITGRFISVASGNLLNNPGFEVQAGSNPAAAEYWETGYPDAHAERWGSAARVSWRPLEGLRHGAICGTWSNGVDNGGFWQEVPAVVGQTYTFGVWFWADNTWSAGQQEIKLEFLNGVTGGVAILHAVTNNFSGVGQSWVYKEVAGTAPAGATWTRVVVVANAVGANGALQFDNLGLVGPNQRVFTVVSAHGAPDPAPGAHAVNKGTVQTNTVPSPVSDGSLQYVCSGWTLAGLNPASGISNLFVTTVTNDAQLTWNWVTNSLYPCTVSLGAATFEVSESNASASIGVVRDDTNGAASVEIQISNGTATAGSDYVASVLSVQFAVGVATQTVHIPILDDLIDEPDETVLLFLANPSTSVSIGAPGSAVLTILDNDENLGTRTLNVVSTQGSCAPPAGMQAYAYGTPLSCSASGLISHVATQLVCAGWAGTGSAPVSGTTNIAPTFPLTQDSSLTWRWSTNVDVTCDAAAHGQVTGLTNGWQALGSVFTLTATASTNYHFAGWAGDVPPAQASGNPLVITADQARALSAQFVVDAGVNLLRNPSFETAGTNANFAAYWNAGDPDAHGFTWGSTLRVNWTNHEGAWQQALRGTWAGAGTTGGFQQEVTAQPGERYRFTAWFWADDGNPYGPWDAASHVMKLEFLSGAAGGEILLGAVTNDLVVVDQTWRSYSVEAVAPTNATWVRTVVMADGVSANGSLQVDDLTLELMSVLAAPVALPATNLAADSFTAHWQTSAAATGYLLDVATNAEFTPDTFADDLFISEYAEGSGQNRYVELYNGTGGTVDLSAYRLCMIENGGAWSERVLPLSGVLAHGETYVIANAAATSATILATADVLATTPGPLDFTGDDAVGLGRVHGGFTNIIDAIGAAGADPGTGWGASGVVDATYNHTLVRHASVRAGNSLWSRCSNEWTVLARDNFSGIGAHTMEGGLLGAFVAAYQDRSCAGVSQTVTGLVSGVTYFYRVRATNETGLSDYSGTISAVPRQPYRVAATAGTHGSITPSGWVDVQSGGHIDFLIAAENFYHIDAILADGEGVPVTNGAEMTVAWGPASANGTVTVAFAESLAVHGTPHWWLDAHYPSDTNYDTLALDDRDFDGSLAWEEFIADTDPTVSNEPFRILSVPIPPSMLAHFESSSNRLYRLSACSDLVGGVWTDVPGAGPRLGVGGADSLQDTNVPPIGWFYRLQVAVP